MHTSYGLLTLFMIIVFTCEVQAQSQRVIKAPKPQPASIVGYEKGHCVALPKQVRVCKALAENEDSLLVEKDGKRIGSWDGGTYLGETSDFEVLHGDIDGDKRAELIVVNHDGTSQGIGVSRWTVAIFSGTEFRDYQPPLTFSVEEYGSFGTFVSAGGTVNILTTNWQWIEDPKGKRGTGMYLVGDWWRYKSGELLPLLDRRTIARRYLGSFELERWESIESDRKPYTWLMHVNAEPIKRGLFGPAKSSQTGSLQVQKLSGRKLKILFRSDSNQTTEFVYPDDDVTEGGNNLRHVGDTASGKLYPERYLPSHPEAWLNGKRATLRTYGDDRQVDVLWIEK